MKRATTWIFLAAATALFGCGQEQQSTPTPASSQPAAAAPIADEDLAIPSDFDDEAEKSITKDNYKAELDSMEKEIDSESGAP